MKTFYLLRHVAYDNPKNVLHGRLPFELSGEGREHAGRIAHYFKDKDIRTIYSSAVLRCKQTSEIIATEIGAPIIYDSRLLELLTVLQGMDLETVRSLPNNAYTYVFQLGGEDMVDVQLRMLDFFHEKIRTEQSNIIVCSHGDPLYFLLLSLTGRKLNTERYTTLKTLYPKKGSIRPVKIRTGGYAVGRKIMV